MAGDDIRMIGRYEVEREIGRGGMAVVYKAFDPLLNRIVAIKLIKMDVFGASVLGSIRERFNREAKALAKLNHSNIVKILDYGEQDGAPFLVMDFIEGVTIKEIAKPIRVDTAVRLLRPIAEALEYVHRQGLLHRDVKPSNIMLTKDEHVILTDFGIVKWVEDEEDFQTLTATGVGIGTPEYMSPEQGRGMAIDGRSDIYSLTIVFYELITGQKPYTADTPVNVLLKQINDPIPDPREIVPEVSESVKRFLDRALAKDPEDRYSTMEQYLLDFDGLKLQSIARFRSGVTSVKASRQREKYREKYIDGAREPGKATNSFSTSDSELNARSNVLLIKKLGKIIIITIPFIILILFIIIKNMFEYSANVEEKQNIEVLIGKTPANNGREVVGRIEDPAILETKSEPLNFTEITLEGSEQQVISAELHEETKVQAITATADQLRIMEQTTVAAIRQEETKVEAITATADQSRIMEQTAVAATAQKIRSIEATASFYKNLQVGDKLFFGNYEQDNIVENGAEQIEWDILDISEGRAILISHVGLDAKSYNHDVGKTNWESCTLRSWLNDQFYEMAFDDEEKKKIDMSYLENPDNHIYGTDGGDYTYDRVYILSYYEVGRFLVTPDTRRLHPSDYAISQRAEIDSTSGFSKWWLRTPGNFPGGTAYVAEDGSLRIDGLNALVDRIVVRPVIKIIL